MTIVENKKKVIINNIYCLGLGFDGEAGSLKVKDGLSRDDCSCFGSEKLGFS